MEPDVSVESGCMIRIVVVGIGEIPGAYLRDYVSLVVSHKRVDLSSVSSFYTEHQKSPFAQQPWSTGSLNFKFLVGGAPRSPWDDFQAQRKIHGLIGLSHCPTSPDIAATYEEFIAICKAYPSALVKRMLAFFPSDAHQVEQEEKKRQHLIFVPPADKQTLELHMQTLMQDMAANFLMEFESWVLHAETLGAIFTTPLDSQASLSNEEVSKAKKRRLCRSQKIIGDYCLLAGSPLDADAHYNTAIELARLTGDLFWHAGSIEGSVCAHVIHHAGHNEPSFDENVKLRYYEVIQLYRRVPAPAFELEAILKLSRFLCRRELAKEVSDLLMSAMEGAKSVVDPSDRLVLYVEVARIFSCLGYERKAAFFSRQVAQLYLQQEGQWSASSALQVLTLGAKTYNVQSKSTLSERNKTDKEAHGTDDESKELLSSDADGMWSTLQMNVLNEMLSAAVRAGDYYAAWSSAARLLRGHYPLITPSDQARLANSLITSSKQLPRGARCSDPCLPFVRLHSVPSLPHQMDIVNRVNGKKDWWTGSAPSGPFIYTPFGRGNDATSEGKQEILWVVGEPVQVLVELANPCAFEVFVDSIYLSLDSGDFEAYPATVTLPSNSTQLVSLSGTPLKESTITLRGCIVHCFNVVTEHIFEDINELLADVAKGFSLSDPFRNTEGPKFRQASNPQISVMPPLPLLTYQIIGGQGASVMYEGEIREVLINISNTSMVPIVEAHMSLTGKQQEHVVSMGHSALQSALPLLPGASIVIPVIIKAGQISTVPETLHRQDYAGNNPPRVVKDTSPLLVIHYAGEAAACAENKQKEGTKVPPGRRLTIPLQMHVLQGLSLVHARLLSMEVPAQINTSDSDLHVESSDSLVKMDPYRGSWGLRLLELELWNPTDVVFEITVCERKNREGFEAFKIADDSVECLYPSTRIDREYSARVLIPLERLKLPILNKGYFNRMNDLAKSERQTRAELNLTIKELSSRVCVKWSSGRSSIGELSIKDAIREALQASAIDVLLPDPLTFGFRVTPKLIEENNVDCDTLTAYNEFENKKDKDVTVTASCKGSIQTHDLIPLEMLVRNNTREAVTLSFSVMCRDVAGENCLGGEKATVLWAGALSGVEAEVPPLGKIVHTFGLCFLVPGDYTLLGAAVIHPKNDLLGSPFKMASSDGPQTMTCSGPPFRLHVSGHFSN
ncbi:hypothetical protein KP509_18G035400 [Ceratopteris richardii]|uniref:Trafficking protein particle complex subunit 9 n=2 Tax=Ceratopteris richardii TaxID=49495 RepID=A0A8T2SQU5_CERRI|nr:hypothetical protein KP509_18G035400 [Ceratopteris richardii]